MIQKKKKIKTYTANKLRLIIENKNNKYKSCHEIFLVAIHWIRGETII